MTLLSHQASVWHIVNTQEIIVEFKTILHSSSLLWAFYWEMVFTKAAKMLLVWDADIRQIPTWAEWVFRCKPQTTCRRQLSTGLAQADTEGKANVLKLFRSVFVLRVGWQAGPNDEVTPDRTNVQDWYGHWREGDKCPQPLWIWSQSQDQNPQRWDHPPLNLTIFSLGSPWNNILF